MIKNTILSLLFSLSSLSVFAQEFDPKASNTWFKIGLNAGVPINGLAETSTFTFGPEISLQYLKTRALGIGGAIGLNYYLAKDNAENFSTIPVAALFRFYPESTGFFTGIELGYAFITKVAGTSGGAYVKPHLGWHTDNWNFTAHYSYILTESELADFETIGVGISYNLRFKGN